MLIPNMPGTNTSLMDPSQKWKIQDGRHKKYVFKKNKASDNQNWSEI